MSNIIFDGPNKLMVVASGIQELDAEIDIYSDWKEWFIQDENSKYLQALRTSGGDPTAPGQAVAPFYFLLNGWRMRPYEGDHQLIVNGNLFVDGGGNPFIPTVGDYNVLVTLNVSNLATTIISRLEISNLQRLIETGREHHTGTGNIWYWDPYGGDDTNDGTAQADAFKTFAYTHATAVNNNHDIIICVPGDPGGVTTTTENCTVSKNYLFVRGPGRDFKVAPTTGRAFTITSNGVEVSSMITESADDRAIVIEGGDFALLKTLWVDGSALNSIEINNSEHTRIGAVHIKNSLSNGLAVGNNVNDLHIDGFDVHYSSGHGITLSGTNIDSTQLGSNIVICDNEGYGLNIGSGADCTIIHPNAHIGHNALGNVNDEGTDTSYGADVQAGNITDKVWDETLTDHQGAGSAGEALAQAATASGLPAEITEQDKLDIADRVWDEQIDEHEIVGSTGEALATISGGQGVDADAIADVVWDEALADHQGAGSAGEALDQAATASGLPAEITEQDKLDIADRVWDEELDEHEIVGSAGEGLATASGVQAVDVDAIVDGVWDETLADHQGVGSTAEALDQAATASGLPAEITEQDKLDIADRVWDEFLAGHTTSGTFGKLMADTDVKIDTIVIKLPSGDIAESGEYTTLLNNIETYILRVLGMVQENYYLDQTSYTTYEGIKLMTSGRLRIYSNAGSVGTASDVIATYQITSTWSNDELTSYKVTKL